MIFQPVTTDIPPRIAVLAFRLDCALDDLLQRELATAPRATSALVLAGPEDEEDEPGDPEADEEFDDDEDFDDEDFDDEFPDEEEEDDGEVMDDDLAIDDDDDMF